MTKPMLRGLNLLVILLFMQPAFGAANFVYHEQTSNFVATPTCPSGGTDTSSGPRAGQRARQHRERHRAVQRAKREEPRALVLVDLERRPELTPQHVARLVDERARRRLTLERRRRHAQIGRAHV